MVFPTDAFKNFIDSKVSGLYAYNWSYFFVCFETCNYNREVEHSRKTTSSKLVIFHSLIKQMPLTSLIYRLFVLFYRHC